MLSYQDLKHLYLEGIDIRKNVRLANFTTFGLGGKVPYMFFPKTLQAFEYLARWLYQKNVDFRVMGFGSNLIVAEKNFDFVVINTSLLSGWELKKDGIVWVLPGVSLSGLIYNLAYKGLGGAAQLAGIPGTIGGAVFMNAGAYGKEIKDIFVKALVLNLKKGETEIFLGDKMEFGYRKSVLQKDRALLLMGAYFKFERDKTETILSHIKEYNNRRWEKQPLLENTAGSVFKRPKPDFYVGTTLEKLGFKGYGQGVKVSSKHAGFFENHGGSWEDFQRLIQQIKQKVKEQLGQDLEIEPEVRE